MRFVKKAMLLVLLATLLGCAANKNVKNESVSLKKETEQSIAQKIAEGKTTKKGVEIMLGLPLSTALDNGLEVWKYELSEPIEELEIMNVGVSSAASQQIIVPIYNTIGHKKKNLNISFDTKGFVKKYSYTISERHK